MILVTMILLKKGLKILSNMDNYFVMDADEELMQKLEELYVSKFMFNPLFPVCCSSGSFS